MTSWYLALFFQTTLATSPCFFKNNFVSKFVILIVLWYFLVCFWEPLSWVFLMAVFAGFRIRNHRSAIHTASRSKRSRLLFGRCNLGTSGSCEKHSARQVWCGVETLGGCQKKTMRRWIEVLAGGIQVQEKKGRYTYQDTGSPYCWWKKSCISWDIRLHENPPWDHVFPVGSGVMKLNQLMFTEGKQLVSMVRGHKSFHVCSFWLPPHKKKDSTTSA